MEGLTVRTYNASDVEGWLKLRDQSFAKERIGVRQWTNADFLEEFLHRWWWRPDWMWLAQTADAGVQPQLVGSVTLAMRGVPEQAKPVVHWLMVQRDWRRRGVGRLLMAHLEAAAWDAGYREIWLETHAQWQAASRFYEALGYRTAGR